MNSNVNSGDPSSEGSDDWDAIRALLEDIVSPGEFDDAPSTVESHAKAEESARAWLAAYKQRKAALRQSTTWIAKNGGSKLKMLLAEGDGSCDILLTGPQSGNAIQGPANLTCHFEFNGQLRVRISPTEHGSPAEMLLVNEQAASCQPFAELVECRPALNASQTYYVEVHPRQKTRNEDSIYALALGGNAASDNVQNAPKVLRPFRVNHIPGRNELEVKCAANGTDHCLVAIVGVAGHSTAVTLGPQDDNDQELVGYVPVPVGAAETGEVFVTVREVRVTDLPALPESTLEDWSAIADAIVLPLSKADNGNSVCTSGLLSQVTRWEGALDVVLRIAARGE